MKRQLFTICFFVFLCLLVACTELPRQIPFLDFSASDYVQIPTIETLTIDRDLLALSQDDIDSIIDMDLSYDGIYKPVTSRTTPSYDDIVILDLELHNHYREQGLSYVLGSKIYPQEFEEALLSMSIGSIKTFDVSFPDDYPDREFAGNTETFTISLREISSYITLDDESLILEYYNCSNMDQVYALITETSNKTVLLDYILNDLGLDDSIDAFPPQGDAYIDETLQCFTNIAEECNTSLDAYLASTLGTDCQTLKDELYNFYKEFLILKAITETENITYTSEDLYAQAQIIANEDGCTIDEVFQNYDELSICYEMLIPDVKSILYNKIVVR